MFPRISHEPRSAPHLRSQEWKDGRQGRPEGDRGRMDEQSYDLVVPVKVENRRASERSGHGIHWREGGNKVAHLLRKT